MVSSGAKPCSRQRAALPSVHSQRSPNSLARRARRSARSSALRSNSRSRSARILCSTGRYFLSHARCSASACAARSPTDLAAGRCRAAALAEAPSVAEALAIAEEVSFCVLGGNFAFFGFMGR